MNYSFLPDEAVFTDIAAERSSEKDRLIPIYTRFLADRETVVSLFERIESRPNSFLLESVTGGEQIARYSFFGSDPRLVFASKGRAVTITENGISRQTVVPEGQDPLHVLEAILGECDYIISPDLPRFAGGVVGYIGYDWVRFLEPVGETLPDVLQVPDIQLLLTDVLCIFDHVRHTLTVVANARVPKGTNVSAIYAETCHKIAAVADLLQTPRTDLPPAETVTRIAPENAESFMSNMSRDDYATMVNAGIEYIRAGDIIQVVLSQRFTKPLHAAPFTVYRALRSLNPSPYMFYLRYENDITIVGASPEILVTDYDGRVTVRPIAGTRPRGNTPEQDAALETELLADDKERAEHIMLVDLGRNDLGRVCEYGSVVVDSLMHVEKYSHVMHIVSNVVGRRRGDKTAFDVLRATFPAGTLSGAPKVRAMQIIEEQETSRRGVYGGSAGYISYSGSLDMAITIRTLLVKDGMAHVQAGGGIVADSDADAEYTETVNKSASVRRAVALAEAGLP